MVGYFHVLFLSMPWGAFFAIGLGALLLAAGSWLLALGRSLPALGFWLLVLGCKLRVHSSLVLALGSRLLASGFASKFLALDSSSSLLALALRALFLDRGSCLQVLVSGPLDSDSWILTPDSRLMAYGLNQWGPVRTCLDPWAVSRLIWTL